MLLCCRIDTFTHKPLLNLTAQDEGQKEAGEIHLWTTVLFVLQDSHVHPQTPMNLIAQEEGEKEAGEINKYVFKIMTQGRVHF